MITTTIGRKVAAAVLAASSAVLTLGGGAAMTSASAAVRPDPGGPGVGVSLLPGELSVAEWPNCPLRRLGTQLIRCDMLTGAGVAAPALIPEWTP